MKNYGLKLRRKGVKKGDVVCKLADDLKAKANGFFGELLARELSVDEINQFQDEFKALLARENETMQKHREIWKPILWNILIACTGIGLIALAVNAGIVAIDFMKNSDKKPLNVNQFGFFARTNSEKLIQAIEPTLNHFAGMNS